MGEGLVPRGPDPTGYSARLAKSPGSSAVHYGPFLRLALRRLVFVLILTMAQPAQAECALDQARWAYDEENRILRLCVKIQGSDQLRCTTFPQPVVIDPFSL